MKIVEYVYYVQQNRPESHPHAPEGIVSIATDDIDIAASFIAGDVLQFDIGDNGDRLIVRKVETKAEYIIDEKLLAKSSGMNLHYKRWRLGGDR